ncbi:NAD(P)H-dependent glycerol-3-phosphate dehydrogenase [Cyanobacterium sp. Dongsha4]|uniref:NAD(P)H-dependent glycerol-3-phosphate dehydrogenase n=1 Tax=Cyanobacterium sp. DS4 TaxID=2878255 RepID=UPI002E808F4D|nr:NAD(P)H-dependent glycerol-3-phosphate dehydrogenase [Cyanobacterium sp. Dongsha4]WVL00683.1 NAD(P)H-dependent glycerol-3-phosphate dehydrogenase [Cyanobacterium sp. Dongsha4]
MTQNPKITIIGSGAWGTTLAYLLDRANHSYTLWSRKSSQSLESVIVDTDIIISAVSMKGVRPIIEQLKQIKMKDDALIVTATKGLDFETTKTPSQILQEAFPDHPIIVLCGPNLSKEIKRGLPAATVVSSIRTESAELVQAMFASDIFRVYVNNDPIGTELGGTLKNVMAIASGVCDGLELGTNAKAALLTRALPEMIRVGTHLGASVETFFGLSGLGDLLATCDSPLSRNYQVGAGLAQGKSLEEIMEDLEGTAEGVNTATVLIKLAHQQKIPVPISYQVYLLLKGKITPQEAVQNLMARELKEEFWFLEF